jgi:hypothetical protein
MGVELLYEREIYIRLVYIIAGIRIRCLVLEDEEKEGKKGFWKKGFSKRKERNDDLGGWALVGLGFTHFIFGGMIGRGLLWNKASVWFRLHPAWNGSVAAGSRQEIRIGK